MRKILSLLLMLALLLPCALAETPQGIDLALTSTYGDGLSLRMTAGLSETPFCSLTLPSGQIDLAFSPDKGLCVQSGGQWAQLLVEGHPVDAALLPRRSSCWMDAPRRRCWGCWRRMSTRCSMRFPRSITCQ